MRHTCEAKTRTGSAWTRHGTVCGLTAKIERDGVWYCGLHDPVVIVERRAKTAADIKRQMAISAARSKLADAERLLVDGVLEDFAKFSLSAEAVVYWRAQRVLDARAELAKLEAPEARP